MSETNIKKYNVLIIDDEEDIRDVMESALELNDLDLNIYKAIDGVDGLNKIRNQKFDLIITDLNMPRMSGKELIQEIKNIHKDYRPTNIIVASGFVKKQMLKDTAGGISIIKKPFTIEDLNRYVSLTLKAKKKKNIVQKSKTQKLDVEFINPFIEATLEVLDVMANVKAEKDFLFLKEESNALGDITGIITINSEKKLGSMSISFTEAVYLKVMSSMLCEEVTEINDENKDGIAELCNQIFGNAKASLNKLGYYLDMTIPTVVAGANHSITHAANGSVVGVYFNTEFGTFVIECIVVNK